MEKRIITFNDYSIWEAGSDCLWDLSDFIIRENYTHHAGVMCSQEISEKINVIYNEEQSYCDNSKIYIARDNNRKMIGTIRCLKWDKQQLLPIQKIFGINPINVIPNAESCEFWHVGRLAVRKGYDFPTLSVFKTLIMHAIKPIVDCDKGYMIAETDKKLLKCVNSLGMQTIALGEPITYLASETVPICCSKAGLSPFYQRNQYLLHYNL